MTLLIANLPDYIKDNDVARLFNLFGEVAFFHLFDYPKAHPDCGTAIVTMRNDERALFALEVLNGMCIDQKPLRVRLLRTEVTEAEIKITRRPRTMFLEN